MIKAVIFDLDDTLYDFKAANITGLEACAVYAEKELGLGHDEFVECFREMLRKQFADHSDVAGCHSRAIRFQMMCERYGFNIRHAAVLNDLYWNSMIDSISPVEGIPELFSTLKERGLKIGICTNMTADWQIRKLDKLGLAALCDFLVSSEEAGVEKPLPAIYALCAEKSGCSPSECLFIGDNPQCDATGAIAAGMRGLWFTWRGEDTSAYPALTTITAATQVLNHLD